MAYSIKNLQCLTNNKQNLEGSGVPSRWQYWNEDDDTVTTAGFIPKFNGVKAGDQIIVVDADYGNSTDYNATANATTGVITLVANA